MSAARVPRLSGGIAASVILHAAFIAGFLLLRPSAPPPEAPTIAIQLIAAPPGERAIGVVQDPPPVPTPAPPTPAPPAPARVVKPAVVKTKAPAVKPTPAAKSVKPTRAAAAPTTAKPVPAPAKPTPQPTAGGGPEGGKGADVANVSTDGIEFPWPYYTTNIVSRLLQRFGNMAGTLSASVHFVIRRDGTVDPETIKIVAGSGNYVFDQRAKGAVEAAANAKDFGPLPSGFREDILPVTMRFSPKVVR